MSDHLERSLARQVVVSCEPKRPWLTGRCSGLGYRPAPEGHGVRARLGSRAICQYGDEWMAEHSASGMMVVATPRQLPDG